MYDQDWINDTPPPKQRKVPQHADLKARIAELEAESERRRAALNDMQDQLVAAALRIATLERERDEARELLSAARRACDLPRVGECEFEGRDRMAAFLGMATMRKAGIATFNDENACEVYIAQWLANRGRAALRGEGEKNDAAE